ncbi:MAG TPA: hypothetical protein VN457_02300 [Chlamydiales bacterium]|nr:hypothetical protein [Chlamydiales bacterium]
MTRYLIIACLLVAAFTSCCSKSATDASVNSSNASQPTPLQDVWDRGDDMRFDRERENR